MQLEKICYFLAKFGIASNISTEAKGDNVKHKVTVLIPEKIYVYDREHDDDRWYEYEKVCGKQLFPINKNFLKYVEVDFGFGSNYRSMIREKVGK
jgi:hypothetical protein